MGRKDFKGFLLEYSLVLLAVVVTVLLVTQYYFSYKMVFSFAEKRFAHLARQSSLIVKEKDDQSREVVAILGRSAIANSSGSFEQQEALLKFFVTPMEHDNKIFSIYIGYPDRNYFEVVNVRHSPAVAKMFNAPKEAHWIVVKVIRTDPGMEVARRMSYFYDANLTYLSQMEETTKYDPLKRPWYQKAMEGKGVVRSSPYRYYRLKKMGITYSMPLEDGKSVLAMDVTLEGLSHFLQELKRSTHTEIYMIEDGKIIASSEGNVSATDERILRSAQSPSETVTLSDVNGTGYFSMTVAPHRTGTVPIVLLFRAEKASMMKPYMRMIYTEILLTLLMLMLLVPLVRYLSRRFIRPIDQLMNENNKIKERAFDEVRMIRSNVSEFDQLSESLVSMAESIRDYEQKQEKLLEAFIHLIADMIDAKSPYTGEHCRKVPVLSEMLIDKANKSEREKFKNFKVVDKEILKGMEWSAWLHDCGKLAVPDYIIDKATKLETVYNRLHEIRTRFEVLLRDARIASLEAVLAGTPSSEAEEAYARAAERLQDDFAFVARMNIGDHRITDEDLQRLKAISRITWQRHFSKRIGLSWQEMERMNPHDDEHLPVEESLISDGKAFQIPRNMSDYRLYEKEHITMKVPKLLYDRGELYNLSIEHGTITPEEMFKIREHAIHTLRILKDLPWNDKLKAIVEDAANHHEYLDGTGYPRSLDEENLTIHARVLVIADIFEALTSADRPYKKSKSLSQAIDIMVHMAQEHKIDADLFGLFIESGIYLEYAKGYLKPQQIDLDNIDEEKILEALGVRRQ